MGLLACRIVSPGLFHWRHKIHDEVGEVGQNTCIQFCLFFKKVSLLLIKSAKIGIIVIVCGLKKSSGAILKREGNDER